MQECRLERARSRAVSPLEIWHLPVDGEPVCGRLGTPAVESMREQGIEEPEIGRLTGALAVRLARQVRDGDVSLDRFLERQREAARRVRGCDRFCFAGGLTRLPGFASFVDEHASRAEMVGDGTPASILRGADRVAPEDAEAVLVVDVGQTAVKTGLLRRTSQGPVVGEVTRVARPTSRLPIDVVDPEAPCRRPAREEAVEEAVAYIGEAIEEARDGVSSFVLALPCAVDDRLRPAPCTYPGWEHAPDLVARIARRAGIDEPGNRLVVLNDAELAGYAALNTLETRDLRGDALVITLGFGPGGAYVDLEADHGGK
ncbi:MAG: hypothetical protein ABEN55_14855 [Bradymonadaceae bacterium]